MLFLLTENSTQLVNKFHTSIWLYESTKVLTTKPCHPQTKRQRNRCNKTISIWRYHYLNQRRNNCDAFCVAANILLLLSCTSFDKQDLVQLSPDVGSFVSCQYTFRIRHSEQWLQNNSAANIETKSTGTLQSPADQVGCNFQDGVGTVQEIIRWIQFRWTGVQTWILRYRCGRR